MDKNRIQTRLQYIERMNYMLIDEKAFKSLVADAVAEALKNQKEEKYSGFANAEQFIEISGISKYDLEYKLMPHPQFKQHVYRFDGHKRYIDVQPALNSVKNIMKRGA